MTRTRTRRPSTITGATADAAITGRRPGPRSARAGERDERGGSQSILVLLIVAALLLIAGLVVDGGRKVAAAQQAEAVAEGAARAGLNAAATDRLAGRPDTTAAVLAARRYLGSAPGVSGSVQLLPGGRLEVRTSSTRPTVYLGAIGMGTVTGRGEAVAALVETGGGG